MARELRRRLCEFVASDINTSDANVKEVVLTALQRTNEIAAFTQVVKLDMAFRDALMFEIAVAG